MKRALPKVSAPPPERLRLGMDLLRWYFAPEYLHLERADKRRPTLFVGNHSLYGVLDVLLFSDGLYRERGIVLRSLADRNHFKVPVWRDFVGQTGAVLGTRANCAALMRRGEHILVFPGGAREVFKHKGEAYQLIWKERFGFVQLAIEHGYTITPYATAGAEEAFAGHEILRRVKQDRIGSPVALIPAHQPAAPVMIGPAMRRGVADVVKADHVTFGPPGAFKALVGVAPDGAAAGQEGFHPVKAAGIMGLRIPP